MDIKYIEKKEHCFLDVTGMMNIMEIVKGSILIKDQQQGFPSFA